MPIDPTDVTFDDLPGEDPDTSEEPEEPETEEEPEEDVTEEPQTEEEPDVDTQEEPESEEEESTEDEEDQTEEEEGEPVPLFEQLSAELGMDEHLDGTEYEETMEGFVDYTQDAVQTAMEQQWQQTFEQYPDIQQYVEYRMQGGDPEEYQETMFNTSWQDREVPEDDTEQQKQIIRENLSDDFGEEEIEEYLDEYEAAGTLETEAKKSLRQLQQEEEREQEQLLEKQEEKAQRQQEQIQEFWNDVEETIHQEDEFHGIPIPEGEKDDFFSFMAEDITDGQGVSQRDKMVQEMGLEERIAIDLILYHDFNLDKLAELKAKTKNAENLRDRLKSSKGRADVTDQQENDVNDGEVDPEKDIPSPQQLLG